MGISYIELLGTRSRPKQSRLGKKNDLKLTMFYLKENIDITNKNILLIDDIYTTGLTVHYAGSVLCNKKSENSKCLRFQDDLNMIL